MHTDEPIQIPERGYYYHYKHDPNISFNHHAYEILGLTRHTEDKSYLVRYRPLYESTYLGKAQDSVRPLAMWFDMIEKEGKSFSRFKKITDSIIIKELESIKAKMYS